MPSEADESVERLEEKRQQPAARQERLEARRQALITQRSHREDTRRKILVGAVVLAKVERGEIAEETFGAGWSQRWSGKKIGHCSG